MAQWLRALAVFAEELVQFPAPLPSYHLLVDQALGAHTYIHTGKIFMCIKLRKKRAG